MQRGTSVNLDSEYILYTMTRIKFKTDKSIIFIDIVDRKGHTGLKNWQDIEKATKNNLKFRLKCRDLKFKSSETKAELFYTLMNLRNRKENRANNLLNVHNSKITYNLI
jgi:hypothetical protein